MLGYIAVYNILGEKEKQILLTDLKPGKHKFRWDGRGRGEKSLPTGIYIIQLDCNGRKLDSKALLLK
jgi:flagellar hook assembly protein FlgD